MPKPKSRQALDSMSRRALLALVWCRLDPDGLESSQRDGDLRHVALSRDRSLDPGANNSSMISPIVAIFIVAIFMAKYTLLHPRASPTPACMYPGLLPALWV